MKNYFLLLFVCVIMLVGTFMMSYYWVTTQCEFTVQETAYIKPAY